MSKRRSTTVSRYLIGVAIGAAAVVIYNRRATLSALITSRREVALLPDGNRLHTISGENAVSIPSDPHTSAANGTSLIQTVSTTLQNNAQTILEQARHYVESARVQFDAAVTEGQITAAQTRQDLEARFLAAKADPQSARSAFDH